MIIKYGYWKYLIMVMWLTAWVIIQMFLSNYEIIVGSMAKWVKASDGMINWNRIGIIGISGVFQSIRIGAV